MARSNRIRCALGAATVLVLSACSSRVWMMVPPKFDLAEYERIGLVEFQCEDASLEQRATLQFQEMVLEADPGSQLIEIRLDAGDGVTDGRGELDQEALRKLAEEYDLDALFVGTLKVSGWTPTVGIQSSLVEVTARAEIRATLSARLIEPDAGATVWVRSADERITVAQGTVNTEGQASVGVTDPQGKHAALVRSLASQVTHDFRPQYFKKSPEQIPPGYLQTYPEGVEVWVPPAAK